MAVNSKQKGKRGELFVAHFLQGYGYDAKRTQQYCGANGDADVEGLPGFHIEAKNVERLNVREAFNQAKVDSRPDEIPTVWWKKNRSDLLVIIKAEDFMELIGRNNEGWAKGT